ncbi:MAG: hypothetical protein M3361_11755 [Candidatus Tectomicrobia bacterium]|nr:hypothetical protein [Candidatus Tectomicrobia bacterium]
MVNKVEPAYSREVTSQLVTRRWIVFRATITNTHRHCGWKGQGEEASALA